METVHLDLKEIKKYLMDAIIRKFGLSKGAISIKKDQRNSSYINIDYTDGPPFGEMEEFVCQFSKGDYFTREPVTWTDGGQTYASEFRLHVHRHQSIPFIKKCALLACLLQGKPLPQLTAWTVTRGYEVGKIWKLDTDDTDLLNAHAAYRKMNASEIDALLAEAQAQHATIQPSDEEMARRVAQEEAEQKAYIRSLEASRQTVLFRLSVYQATELPNAYQAAEKDLILVETKTKAVAPTFSHPVVCHYCFSLFEQSSAHEVNQLYVCQTCASTEEIAPSAYELPTPKREPLSDEIIPGTATVDMKAWQSGMEEYRPIPTEQGLYLAKNGQYMPVLTRDLMHDCRLNNWWLWFSEKPSEEVRAALHKAGWNWGWGRKQWFHSNKYGQVPDMVIDVYGGYIDGGYCDYRSHRGERLRAYADRAEDKAEQESEWSNEIVAKYMSTGCFVTTYRNSRKMSKLKTRAERKAQKARRLDQWAHELRRRANSSETHQYRMSSTRMLQDRIETLETERRKFLRNFCKAVDEASIDMLKEPILPETFIDHYERVVDYRIGVIDEEIDLLRLTIAKREEGQTAPDQPLVQAVPSVPDRPLGIDGVTEVYVGDNPTDVYPTPPEVGYLLLNHSELPRIPEDATLILEPEGGIGSLIDQINAYLDQHSMAAIIHTYEIVWDLQKVLEQKKCVVMGSDFLDAPDDPIYDAIVMNPPFSKWVDHVAKAFRLLKSGGVFLCILPIGWVTARGSRAQAFAEFVAMPGTSIDLQHGAFLSSGTNVAVSLMGVVKP